MGDISNLGPRSPPGLMSGLCIESFPIIHHGCLVLVCVHRNIAQWKSKQTLLHVIYRPDLESMIAPEAFLMGNWVGEIFVSVKTPPNLDKKAQNLHKTAYIGPNMVVCLAPLSFP